MVKLHNITQSFQGKCILSNLNLTLHGQEVVALLGPSGVGKTTLLRVLAGTSVPQKGEVIADNKKIAYVFQEPRLLPWKTALENAAFALRCNGIGTRSEQLRVAEELLRELKLGDFLDYYPGQLSGGMKQRVSLARAFALKPDLLLLDEPFNALDWDLKQVMYTSLNRLLQWHPATTVFVTHDPREAIQLADRLIVLKGSPARIACDIRIQEMKEERDEETHLKYLTELKKLA